MAWELPHVSKAFHSIPSIQLAHKRRRMLLESIDIHVMNCIISFCLSPAKEDPTKVFFYSSLTSERIFKLFNARFDFFIIKPSLSLAMRSNIPTEP